MLTRISCAQPAPGGPGSTPHWTQGNKEAIGTAYSTGSRVWYTVSRGVLDEIYYPTIDRPQVRDVQYLISDGKTFFHDERQLVSQIEGLSEHCMGTRISNRDPAGRYRIVKEIIADPHESCVLMRTRVEIDPDLREALKLFVLCAPHLEVGGWHNSGQVARVGGRTILTAHKGETWLALAATLPFNKCSVGYVGVNDGWQDLSDNYQMDWEFDCASDGNIALMGELDLTQGTEFTLGLAFGNTSHNAVTTLFQSLGIPFTESRERFVEQWQRPSRHIPALEALSGDDGRLYHKSQSVLLAHEDKLYPGALIASLSIPWGEAKDDREGEGGYHLVWTRDMVNSATGLLATGNTSTPLRALIYLAVSQQSDGGFHQNFWVNGESWWQGIQLDEVAFPVLLAWRLHTQNALRDFDPYPMVMRAAAFLIRNGPATAQERWEENSGYSPSTLATNIAALTCAASFARLHGDVGTATFIQEYADFLESHVEQWTVTTDGTLLAGIKRHYIRIHPVDVNDAQPEENPNHGILRIANRTPGTVLDFPAQEIVDAGFLELVRYGIRKAGDPLIEDSLQVIDALLKVETPFGPCWRRYNHDGYGQRTDGGPYLGWGKGRAWPLLTGERGHYELAAGRTVTPFIRALEGFASPFGLLPEQVWDEADRPAQRLFCGGPTGAAMPLNWAHAEYIKLLRSTADGQVFDFIPEVAEHYRDHQDAKLLELWKPNRQTRAVKPGWTLRVQSPAAFVLHWSDDEWQNAADTRSTPTALGIGFVDIPIAQAQRAPIRFTFRWLADERWEGRDYIVAIDTLGFVRK
ncbi:MAG: glycoside hydrolase family 15 protein [Chloroflexota bacterium]